ncbi:MAG: PorP/SprF family type IX secretion system membrane protein [Bacteroidetes bacterium]|nr:PorP/SprF family type IX secretion system membrane protein [Bacteroidota bacterium]
MKPSIYKIILVLSILGNNWTKAQDVHFSQFYENAILRNPSLTGIFTGDYRVTVNYRNQWSSFATAFNTTLINAETKIPIRNDGGDVLSVGLCAYYDKAGTINFNSLATYLALNYSKALDDEHHTFLSVGLAGGYLQRSIDVSKMTFGNQYVAGNFNNSVGSQNISNNHLYNFDVGAGVSVNSSIGSGNRTQYYIGIAGYHVQKPKQSFNDDGNFVRLNTRWTGSLGLSTALNESIHLVLHGYAQWQDPYQEIIGGGMLSFSSRDIEKHTTLTLSAGCYYRWQDAIIPTLKLEYKNWGLVLSYDVNSSGKRMYINQAGGYEISLFSRGFFLRNKDSRDALICPRFESTLIY